jgi:hypothetical protein
MASNIWVLNIVLSIRSFGYRTMGGRVFGYRTLGVYERAFDYRMLGGRTFSYRR